MFRSWMFAVEDQRRPNMYIICKSYIVFLVSPLEKFQAYDMVGMGTVTISYRQVWTMTLFPCFLLGSVIYIKIFKVLSLIVSQFDRCYMEPFKHVNLRINTKIFCSLIDSSGSTWPCTTELTWSIYQWFPLDSIV